MSFIELTSEKTGRTIHVRAECIEVIADYINDDEPDCYSTVQVGGVTLQVLELQDEILRRIQKSTLSILTAFIAKYGHEDGVRRFQAGENPP